MENITTEAWKETKSGTEKLLEDKKWKRILSKEEKIKDKRKNE